MSSNPNPRVPRSVPFTPRRAVATGNSMERLTRATVTPNSSNLLASTHKKYKAPISSDVKSRTNLRAASSNPKTSGSLLPPVSESSSRPSSPTKSDSGRRTPGTPRRGNTPDPSLVRGTSEMDVTNVDVEEVLVDYQTVEPADVSIGEMDEAWLKTVAADHGKEDKVMVSVRIRPDGKSAWKPSISTNTIELDPVHARQPTSFTFDAILTGSPNKPIFTTVARSHVVAAMEGYNAVIFAYGQTASGKTYTLSGSEAEPGIIPRAMRAVFGYIKNTEKREYLLRCSYLEIYNEQIHDLLAPPGAPNKVELQGGGSGKGDVILSPLREEVVTSIKAVKDVLKRGEGHRRTACTDWNERSSRSHSVFRLVIESRERADSATAASGRATPSGRQTPGLGGPRLQSRDGRSVQTSVLSLIDLAGSEKATSDKERTREGKYINTSLLTLGTVIGRLSDNATKAKNDHIPFRDSKLTRLLQPSLSGNARISVICTINPESSAITESTSTLLFAKRVKGVRLNAVKKEVVDTDALIERYRKEIEDLRRRLEEKENLLVSNSSLSNGNSDSAKDDLPAAVVVKNDTGARGRTASGRRPRMSAQEKADESQAMQDLQSRIQQLTKLILTSQTVGDSAGDEGAESRPVSPVKVDFEASPYQLQQELLSARLQLSSQATQILSLEAALEAAQTQTSPSSEPDSSQSEIISTLENRIIELEGQLDSQSRHSTSMTAAKGDFESAREELVSKLDSSHRQLDILQRQLEGTHRQLSEKDQKLNEKEQWAQELVKQLDKERRMRGKLEDERRALTAFVSKFDSLGIGMGVSSAASTPVGSPLHPSGGRRRSSVGVPAFGNGNVGAARRRSSAFGLGGSSLRQPLFPTTLSESSRASFISSSSSSSVGSTTSASSIASSATSLSSSPSLASLGKRSTSPTNDSPLRLPEGPNYTQYDSLLEESEAWVIGAPGDISFDEAELGMTTGSRVPSVAGGMKGSPGKVRFSTSVGVFGASVGGKENVTPLQ
ncbi:P-loop containing nucleoside triphosphate hydrolase protein [Rhodocollybia butyracea]|uniref:P-loop containing nucleoside triphosphate hydrolase protein n=1 Tax=Rhodocollybia butyracea TaxID=206335 RepID=A0A9P5PJR9_9AGAR|nr:P-loop containing nucleoside triphosphate hydrolase protein [Rhodocollybia butyracea]